jgi:GT2 family glycosyltransferase
LLLPDGSTQHSVQEFPSLRVALQEAFSLGRGAAHRFNLEQAAWVPWATGAFLLLRRVAFEQVGRSDETQWLYAEDLDLCWRLNCGGWGVRYEPSAHVRHEENAETAEAFGEKFSETWLRATYAWQARRQGIGRTWATALVRLVPAVLRFVLLTLLARRFPERFGWRATRARRAVRAAWFGLRAPGDLLRAPSTGIGPAYMCTPPRSRRRWWARGRR